MGQRILLTGATGALGPPLITALLLEGLADSLVLLIRPEKKPVDERFEALNRVVSSVLKTDEAQAGTELDRLRPVAGDIRHADLGMGADANQALAREIEIIIHAAADTRLRAPLDPQRRTNVEGTQNLLKWARGCPRLSQFILISTTCVAGSRTGRIAEEPFLEPVDFLNNYERTKWQAENVAYESGLPVRILRLSTVLGSEHTGFVHRLGAVHHALGWLYRGLIPMIPGTPETPVDLISNEMVAQCVVRSVTRKPNGLEIHHIAAGSRAVPLGELLNFIVNHFRSQRSAWGTRQIEKPLIVDELTFDLFCRSVKQSGNVLFGRVLESVDSFLPALQHPKIYETVQADALWGGPLPLPDWRKTLERVIAFCQQKHWEHSKTGGPCGDQRAY